MLLQNLMYLLLRFSLVRFQSFIMIALKFRVNNNTYLYYIYDVIKTSGIQILPRVILLHSCTYIFICALPSVHQLLPYNNNNNNATLYVLTKPINIKILFMAIIFLNFSVSYWRRIYSFKIPIQVSSHCYALILNIIYIEQQNKKCLPYSCIDLLYIL